MFQSQCVRTVVAALLNPSGIKRQWERLHDLENRLFRCTYPFAETKASEPKQETVQKLSNDWQKLWGDLNDPETQRKLQELSKAAKESREKWKTKA